MFVIISGASEEVTSLGSIAEGAISKTVSISSKYYFILYKINTF